MYRMKDILLLGFVLAVVAVVVILLATSPEFKFETFSRTATAREEQELRAVLEKAYVLEEEAARTQETSRFAEVFANSPDYQLSKYISELIRQRLGEGALTGAGYLTYKQAYFMSRESLLIQATLAPGMKPTLTPIVNRPDPRSPISQPEFIYSYFRVMGNRAVVRYDPGWADMEATLLLMNDGWRIVAVRTIWAHA